MGVATFCFQGELNYFLPSHQKEVNFVHQFKERPSIKDAIESLGVPHPEVNYIVVNQQTVDFSYILQDGDRVIIYPAGIVPDVVPIISLQPPLPTKPKFILDVHLGKLASSLRMLGFDTLYRNDYEDAEIAEIGAKETRIILTRDRGVLMRSVVTYGYYVRSTKPSQQIVEILQQFNLLNLVKPFQRCIRCNGILKAVDKKLILDQLPLQTRREIEQFHRCNNCSQIYWQGSHFSRMEQFVQQVLSNTQSNSYQQRKSG
ncbi:protein of unknown function DUF82 [Stanieria cyanosphaera PCC 7437]|uniref:Twitching motility protein PilT n=1 Tax=Stanieria cyanosphaera (strain ATCC 29371 / PCC 7437) TaxID=111780 RepID=K9XPJ2_STAC7|nr:Mut7-C RNAse domain-containing protein [Stanieria cyanosphaera]AFZ34453.1 protein of unknown function DUF82 [Stanieria cyanosphaera PCC 7437]